MWIKILSIIDGTILKYFINILNFLAVLSILSCLFFQRNETYKYIFLLPLAVLLLNFIFYNKLLKLKDSMVFIVIISQILIRYIILPPMISSGSPMLSGFMSQNSNLAILMMTLELITIYSVFSIVSKKQRNSFILRAKKMILIERSFIVYFFLIGCFVYILFSGYLGKINFIWNLGQYVEGIISGDIEDSSSVDGLLFNLFRIILSLQFISWIVNVKSFKPSTKSLLLLGVVAVNTLIIVGKSRFSIVLVVLPLFVVILLSYYEHRKKLIFILILIMVPVFLITSFAKFTREYNNVEANTFFKAESLNAYFSGPGNVSSGLDSYYKIENKENFYFLLNDLFQNIPVLSKYTVDLYKSNVYFNYEIYNYSENRTQIVPLTTAGLFHFNVFGGFIYAPLFTLISFYFERMFYKNRFIGNKYVFITLAFSTSLVFMLNIGSITSAIFRNIMFVYIPVLALFKFLKIKLR